MGVIRHVLRRMFGRPQGALGRLGGVIMARTNADCAAWVAELLEIEPGDSVLEVGFGPGIAIQRVSELAPAGNVAGIDQSREMVEQARARHANAIQSGRVDLRYGSVESLPFEYNSFDKALAINSMQVWPDAAAGLREMRRVMKSEGRIALGFTRYSGQANRGLTEALRAAGFTKTQMAETDRGFCVLGIKP